VRFGVFEADFANSELRKHGVRLRLQQQPFQVLAALLERPGNVVTREELIVRLWSDGTTVDFDRGLNAAVTRLRQVLSDSAEAPKYVETVAGRGYRFVAPAESLGNRADPPAPAPHSPQPNRLRWIWPAAVLFSIAATTVAIWLLLRHGDSTPEKATSFIRLTSDTGLTTTPALSEDGKLIAYASDRGGEGNLDIWVQQVGSHEAIRLTRGGTDSYDPSFSPDGRRIAFRSEQDGGGIYVIPTLGGESRRIAPLGRRPRFSPDGNWIAYWIGSGNAGFLPPGSGKIYIAPSAGGTSRELRPEFAASGYPIWTPDSKHILFLGNRDPKVFSEPVGSPLPADTQIDWWVTPLEDGPAVATGVNAALRALGFVLLSQVPSAWISPGDGVLMSGALADTTNLWMVPISPKTWKVSSAPRRLTFGTTLEAQPSPAAGNQVAFSSLQENVNIWSLPIDANRPKPAGGLRRLTQDTVAQAQPAVSRDGKLLAFSSRRSGNRAIWIKDLVTGKETAIANTPWPEFYPAFSPDASRLAYRSNEKQAHLIYVVSVADGAPERVCKDCAALCGWTDRGFSTSKRRPGGYRSSISPPGRGRCCSAIERISWTRRPSRRTIAGCALMPPLRDAHVFSSRPSGAPGWFPRPSGLPSRTAAGTINPAGRRVGTSSISFPSETAFAAYGPCAWTRLRNALWGLRFPYFTLMRPGGR
jgi:Tol biopolymer transport system component/DNA-binding winged helix-turn-helix (wHTH) protein